jgi:hypothetical protein
MFIHLYIINKTKETGYFGHDKLNIMFKVLAECGSQSEWRLGTNQPKISVFSTKTGLITNV